MLTLYAKNVNGVWFGAACQNETVYATAFAFNKKNVLLNLLRNIPFNVPFQHKEKTTNFAEKIVSSLAEIYQGYGCFQSFKLDMQALSCYARKVIQAVASIPVGYVSSYGSVAKVSGGSARAVGRVMALNPFPLIIPCHRVVASNFSLTGYMAGSKVKMEILRREKRGFTSEKIISIDDGDLRVFPVEFALKSA
ncbi:MAG: methylated-DNA--[protein]-cysteine S-methyltransferase [Candidatus Bathyarchaeia archaeon]